jgi:hypothetical protein
MMERATATRGFMADHAVSRAARGWRASFAPGGARAKAVPAFAKQE